MPIEIPYIDPKSVSENVLPLEPAKPRRLTVGSIALAVFLGNLLTTAFLVVASALYYFVVHYIFLN